MFQLSLVDHIRLSFAAAADAYQCHADAARRLARWTWGGKLGLTTIAAVATVLGFLSVEYGRGWHIAAAAATALTFVASATYLALDLEPRIHGHRSTAARFWMLTEKYRALLAEVHDQFLDAAAVAARRDALLEEARAIFEHAPPADRQTSDIARQALSGTRRGGYSDEEIDSLLPASLHRPKQPA